MQTQKATLWLFGFWVLFGTACANPAGVLCQTDSDCFNGFQCLEDPTGKKVCVKKSTSLDASVYQEKDKRDSIARLDATPQEQEKTQESNIPVEKMVSNEQNFKSDQDISPKTNCKLVAYDASKDVGNGGVSVSLDAYDQAFFKRLHDIYQISETCHESVWGGKYQMHKIPTYVVNVGSNEAGSQKGTKGFLINHPNPPAGSQLVDSKMVFGLKNVYWYDGDKDKIPYPGFDFSMKIHSVECYAFEYGSSDDFINPLKGKEVFAFFVHEGFHRAQEHEENWMEAFGSQDLSSYPMDADTLALSMLEGRVLLDAYNQKETAEKVLKTFYAIRSERIQKDTSKGSIEKYDNFQEWLEGTAQYVEERYMIALQTPYMSSEINSIPGRIELLEDYFDFSGWTPSRTDIQDGFTSRMYATGALLGIALDQLGDTSWKDQIKAGKTFYDILKAKYGTANSADKEQWIQSAKNKHDYTQLHSLATRYSNLP